MLAVALKEAFRTALTGRCDARPELAAQTIPLAIRVPALRCRGGAELARAVFEPLGWTVAAESQPLQPAEWGASPYLDLRLTGEVRLADALNHLYVLLPVLDDAKHYWVSTDEVDKLIRAGGDWLARHPARDLIARRYLSHRRALTRSALTRLAEADDTEPAPERTLVSVPAARVYHPPAKPFPVTSPSGDGSGAPVRRDPDVLDIADVSGVPGHRDRLPAAGRGPRGPCRGGPRGDEPVRPRSALAGVPAADHEPGRHLHARGPAGAPRAGVFGLPHGRRGPCAVRGKAHGLARRRAGLPHARRRPGPVRPRPRRGSGSSQPRRGSGSSQPRRGSGSSQPRRGSGSGEQSGLVQPGLKVRGREYLRLIYGPDYTEPGQLDRLRQRALSHKRSLALREYALGLEALDRVARGEPLWRVHECVFAVLALESEPVDPRL
jgi:RNA repair, ligase-Pnkp-associating, region of Hen1/PNKP adenylyltransferase domain, C-terminal region/PNKP adenylyltransferase domain, ligase domain